MAAPIAVAGLAAVASVAAAAGVAAAFLAAAALVAGQYSLADVKAFVLGRRCERHQGRPQRQGDPHGLKKRDSTDA